MRVLAVVTQSVLQPDDELLPRRELGAACLRVMVVVMAGRVFMVMEVLPTVGRVMGVAPSMLAHAVFSFPCYEESQVAGFKSQVHTSPS
jgi:hypothetical protein